MTYLLGPLFIEKKYLYEIKLCCDVLMEATDRRLNKKNHLSQQNVNFCKICVFLGNNLGIIYYIRFTLIFQLLKYLGSFKFVYDTL